MSTSAAETVVEIRTFYERLQREIKPDQAIDIIASGHFGAFRTNKVIDNGHGFLQITLIGDRNQPQAFLLAPFEQCSFMFSIVSPTEEERVNRPPMGFGP